MVKKYQKILLGIISLSLFFGLVGGKSKFFFRGLFLVSSGGYLISSKKPWKQRSHELKYKLTLERDIEGLRSQLSVFHNGSYSSLAEARLAASLKEAQKVCEEFKLMAGELEELGKLRSRIEDLKQQQSNYKKEVTELKSLADQIAAEAESEALLLAAEIKKAAEVEAAKIIENTRASLQRTAYEPEELAHRQVLESIEAQKQEAINQLERLQSLQNKTAAAIQKMKLDAKEEHAAIKKNLQAQAQKQFTAEMKKMQDVLEQLNNQVKLLESENQMLRSELKSLDLPKLPEGWNFAETYARGLIEFYQTLGIKLDYESSFKEADQLRIRVIPREKKVGEQQLRAYSDRLMREMKLTQLPNIATIDGTIQFLIKVVEIQSLIPAQIISYQPPTNYQLPEVVHPELTIEQTRDFLEKRQIREFTPPNYRFNPKDPICQIERDWVLWLWEYCKIQDQNMVMRTVWKNTRGSGISPGAGSTYRAAREKLHKILDGAGIERKFNSGP